MAKYAIVAIVAVSSVGSVACKAYQLPSTSMEPTLLSGDYFFVAASTEPPARHEIVVYHHNGLALIKRVAGIPGDTVSMRAGRLFVNGARMDEPFAQHQAEDPGSAPEFAWQRPFLVTPRDSLKYFPTSTNWGPLTIPAGKYLILGDNRGKSFDSRYTGFVDGDDIFARPTFIYFSLDREAGKVRWNRIGRAIKRRG
jgi:signal peptidase I